MPPRIRPARSEDCRRSGEWAPTELFSDDARGPAASVQLLMVARRMFGGTGASGTTGVVLCPPRQATCSGGRKRLKKW